MSKEKPTVCDFCDYKNNKEICESGRGCNMTAYALWLESKEEKEEE